MNIDVRNRAFKTVEEQQSLTGHPAFKTTPDLTLKR